MCYQRWGVARLGGRGLAGVWQIQDEGFIALSHTQIRLMRLLEFHYLIDAHDSFLMAHEEMGKTYLLKIK